MHADGAAPSSSRASSSVDDEGDDQQKVVWWAIKPKQAAPPRKTGMAPGSHGRFVMSEVRKLQPARSSPLSQRSASASFTLRAPFGSRAVPAQDFLKLGELRAGRKTLLGSQIEIPRVRWAPHCASAYTGAGPAMRRRVAGRSWRRWRCGHAFITQVQPIVSFALLIVNLAVYGTYVNVGVLQVNAAGNPFGRGSRGAVDPQADRVNHSPRSASPEEGPEGAERSLGAQAVVASC